jgi:hypothetical protein
MVRGESLHQFSSKLYFPVHEDVLVWDEDVFEDDGGFLRDDGPAPKPKAQSKLIGRI